MFLFHFTSWLKQRLQQERDPAQSLEDLTQTFILEPIYTPSGLVDAGDDDAIAITDGSFDEIDIPDLDESETDSYVMDDDPDDSLGESDDSSGDETSDSDYSENPVDVENEEIKDEDIGEEISFSGEENDDDLDEGDEEPSSQIDSSEEEEITDESDSEEEEIADELEDSDESDSEEEEIADESENSDESDSEEEEITDELEDSDESDSEEEEIADESDSEEEITDELEDSDESDSEEEESEEEDEEDNPLAFEFPAFNSGIFQVGDSGEVGVDFLFDGGAYQGEVAFFSLAGFDELEFDRIEDFIAEAAQRAASGSEQGHIVIRVADEGARFTGSLFGEPDWNTGVYQGVKTFNMTPGDEFGVMLVPNGRVSEVLDNPSIGGAKRPLFSLAPSNPQEGFHLGQIADLTGDGNTFVFEDQRFERSDRDYDDVIFQIRGAVGDALHVENVIDPDLDWRQDNMGKMLLAYSKPYITPVNNEQWDLAELVELGGDEIDISDDFPSDEGIPDNDGDLEDFDEVTPEETEADSFDETEDETDVAETDDSQLEEESVNQTGSQETQDSSQSSTETLDPWPVSEEASSSEVDSSLGSQPSIEEEVEMETPGEVTVSEDVEEPVEMTEDSDEETMVSEMELQETVMTEEDSETPPAQPKPLVTLERFEFAKEDQPLVGIIDTGFAADNPDLDYDNITLGRDWVDGDDNPLLAEGEGNEHGTHILGIIAAKHDNGIGIDGINPDAPMWLGRAVGSGEWANSLVEFVDAAVESGQPNAVVNLSLDLTQIDAEGNVTTRYELTPMERAAIEYARQNNVMIVAAAGNDGGVMSALGQASQEFDNIMTVGAAEQFDPETSVWKGADRTDYSSYGRGLDVMAYGGTTENPQLSLAGDDVGTMAGSSVATAKVTGAVSQVWAANPELSYRQVVDIIQMTATDLGSTGFNLETGAGLLNMTAAVHLAKATKPEEHRTPALLSPETWSGEGVFTPGERAVQNVVVPPEWRRWYYGWLNDSNPSDTFAFSIDEPTPLQFSLNVLGSAVLRKNGQVVLEGKYDGNMLYGGSDGKLAPGSYVLTVDRGNHSKVDQYKLVMNFVEGSEGKEEPFIDYLPGPKPVQPPPDNPPATDITEWIKKLAEERAKEAILEAYEYHKDKLGDALEDIQVHWKAFNGVNVPAVQYFDGGYIIWNGVSAIPYFTGSGHKLPNLDLPETIAPIWQPTPQGNRLDVPDGRHTYPNMRGSSEYRVTLKGDKNDISLAARDTVLAHPDLRTTVYRDFGGGRLQQVPLTEINPGENYTSYRDLPPGKYIIKVDVEQNKARIPYRMIVNLDQAGDSLAKARNLNREYGKVDGKRIIVSDHVGLPQGDKDLYAFTTSNFQPTLEFAVRSFDSDLDEVTRNQLLDGDVKMRLLDAQGDEVLSVDSENRKPILAAEQLKPNSKYYVEVTAKHGSRTNYDLVLNFEELWAPPGRHIFSDLTDQIEYKFRVDNNATNRTLHTAVRDARGNVIPSRHYTSNVYRKQNGQWVSVNPNSTGDTVLRYDSLRSGEHRVVVTPKPWMPSSKNYSFVHNLDQAGRSRSEARNLGNIGGKRVTVNDHVGIPTSDWDYYKFSTDSAPRLLHFAVLHPNGSDYLEGDFEFALYDKNGKELKKVISRNQNFIYATYDLDANSEYYVRVKAQSGHSGNYRLVLNAKEKRTVKPDPKPGYVNNNVGNSPLNMRNQPSLQAGIITRLNRGTELKILRSLNGATYQTPNGATRSDWYEVEVGGQRGYVAAYYVSQGKPPEGGDGSGGPITTQQQYLNRLYGGSPGVITQGYVPGHLALDSVHQGSTPRRVYSLSDGVIRAIATDRFGGRYVMVWNQKLQRNFFYVHFNSFNPNLRVGQQISAGTYLGIEGWTGNVYPSGPAGRHTHVHVETTGGVREYPIAALSRL